MGNYRLLVDSFFTYLDSYLKNNLHGITGHELASIYSCFWEKLKGFRGNANGFTGLSELLVFRLFFHLLNERVEFGPEPKGLTKALLDFRSKDNRFSLGQATPVPLGRLKTYPDISLKEGEELLLIVQIKISPAGGRAEVIKEYETFVRLRERFENLRCLFLIFTRPSEGGKLHGKLEELKQRGSGFDYLALEKNDRPVTDELTLRLDLDSIFPSKKMLA